MGPDGDDDGECATDKRQIHAPRIGHVLDECRRTGGE